MEYNKLIAGMHTGDDVEGFYVLKDAFLKTTAAGKPFLSGVLADRSGTIDLKVWDYSGPIGANPADTGSSRRAASVWRTAMTSMTCRPSCRSLRSIRTSACRRSAA